MTDWVDALLPEEVPVPNPHYVCGTTGAVCPTGEHGGPSAVTADSELAQELYPIFVALVDWCRKAGRTETNAIGSAAAALRTIGVGAPVRMLLRSRYMAGSRATAELDHENKL